MKITKHLRKNWFKYGLETLVVVVGVLGAFSLNNWNEYRKDRAKESELLLQIQDNIRRNMDELVQELNTGDTMVVGSMKRILRAIEDPDVYRDSIVDDFNVIYLVTDPPFTYAGYNALQDASLEIIENPVLRDEIVTLFDVRYPWLQAVIDELEITIIKPSSGTFVYDNFYRDFSNGAADGRLVPNNYDELMRSEKLKNIASQNLGWTRWFMGHKRNILRESEVVLSLIEQELASK